MENNRRDTGTRYEKDAALWLRSRGYQIYEMNYHSGKYGEADIIAGTEGTIVFVEVKYRSDLSYGSPFEAVDFNKQYRICRVADRYLISHGMSPDTACRFDVIGITGDEFRHIPNAFSYIPSKGRGQGGSRRR